MAVEISGPPVEKIVEALQKRWQTTWLCYFDAAIKKFGIEYAISELFLALQDSKKPSTEIDVNFYRFAFKVGVDLIPHMPLATAEATVSKMVKISAGDYQDLCEMASQALQKRRECEANTQAGLAGVIARQSFLTNPNHYLTGHFP